MRLNSKAGRDCEGQLNIFCNAAFLVMHVVKYFVFCILGRLWMFKWGIEGKKSSLMCFTALLFHEPNQFSAVDRCGSRSNTINGRNLVMRRQFVSKHPRESTQQNRFLHCKLMITSINQSINQWVSIWRTEINFKKIIIQWIFSWQIPNPSNYERIGQTMFFSRYYLRAVIIQFWYRCSK